MGIRASTGYSYRALPAGKKAVKDDDEILVQVEVALNGVFELDFYHWKYGCIVDEEGRKQQRCVFWR